MKDLRCSRAITIDNMALTGVAGASPTHHDAADCLAVRLQVRWRATEEEASEHKSCRRVGGSALFTAQNDQYSSRWGNWESESCVRVSVLRGLFTACLQELSRPRDGPDDTREYG